MWNEPHAPVVRFGRGLPLAHHPHAAMAKTTKLRLDLEPDPEVNVIGISCHVNDYRLCWSLNRSIGIALSRRERDIQDEGDASYAAFDHDDAETEARFTLVNNRGGSGLLVKEQRSADYFLVVDERAPFDTDQLLERVRNAEFVLAAFPLPFDQLRAGHKLLR